MEAEVVPLARTALERLQRRISLVGAVSGRSVADTRRLVRLDDLFYAGNHGFELWHSSGAAVLEEARPWVRRVAEVLDRVRSHVNVQGVLCENKGATASIHYRMAHKPEVARHAILDALLAIPEAAALRMEEGRMVINLVPPLPITKGSVVCALAETRDLRGIVYLGDDTTDVHAFEALERLRRTGQVATFGIAVARERGPSVVAPLADAVLPSPAAAAELLAAVADVLEADGR